MVRTFQTKRFQEIKNKDLAELQDKYIQISKQTKGVVILKLGKVESKVKSTERDTDE